MLELMITACIFGFVTSALFALMQRNGSAAALAQARLERVAGNMPYSDWLGSSVVLRGNRMSSIQWVERMLANRDFAMGLDLLLIRAAWRMRVSEFLATCLLAAGFIFFMVNLFLG